MDRPSIRKPCTICSRTSGDRTSLGNRPDISCLFYCQLFSGRDIQKLETNNTNWFKEVTRPSFTSSHNLSISGGSERVRYMTSLGYSKDIGQEKGNDVEKINMRLNLDFDLSKRVQLAVSLAGTITTTKGFAASVNPLNYARITSRMIPLYDDQGERVYYRRPSLYGPNRRAEGLGFNILNEMENSGVQVRKPQINANVDLKIRITDALSYQATVGCSVISSLTEGYVGEETHYVARWYRGYDYWDIGSKPIDDPEYKSAMLPAGGFLTTVQSLTQAYTLSNRIVYDKSFSDVHKIIFRAGVDIASSWEWGKSSGVAGYSKKRGESTTVPQWPDDMVPIQGSITKDSYTIYKHVEMAYNAINYTRNTLSQYLNLAYIYDDKYVLNASFRNDASNTFGQNTKKKFMPVFGVGVKWRVDREGFMQSVSERIVRTLDLSVDYGIQGNDLSRSLSPDLIINTGGFDTVYGQYKTTIVSLPNPSLTWEKTKSLTIAADASLFSGLMTATVKWYTRKSNAMGSVPSYDEYGGASFKIPANGLYIRNRGLEFNANINVVRSGDWFVSLGMNASRNWNKLVGMTQEFSTDMQNNMTIVHYLNGVGAVADNGTSSLIKGYSIGTFWRFSYNGLERYTGAPTFNYIDPSAADYRGHRYDQFLVVAGSNKPDLNAGFQLNVRYKRVRLGGRFAGNFGNVSILPTPYANFTTGSMVNPEKNVSSALNDRWKAPGDENKTDIPSLATLTNLVSILNSLKQDSDKGWYSIKTNDKYTSLLDVYNQSTALTVSGSYFKCNNLSLSVDLPVSALSRIGLKTCSLSGQVSNVFVIAHKKWNGMDPESPNQMSPKVYTLSLSVGF